MILCFEQPIAFIVKEGIDNYWSDWLSKLIT